MRLGPINMPIQHLFTKREQRILAGRDKQELIDRSAAYWRNAGYSINFYGPFVMHAERVESHLGLRQTVDLTVSDYNRDQVVDISVSATVGDIETVAGVVGVVVVPLAAVAVGAVSYIDYDTRATAAMRDYWIYLYNLTPEQLATLPASGKVRCPNCGTEIEADSKFCRSCGRQL